MLKNKLLWTAIMSILLVSIGCRYDMQDQPRYKAYKEMPEWKTVSRETPTGTVARGMLRNDKALYTGKKEGVSNVQVQTTTDASGNTLVASFPDAVEEFPVPITKELVDRGEERYNIYCIVCHGPTGNGDGMIVRRGFTKPPTYNDDRLRNAPVGHFFDVITNGWGKMSSYSSQIPVADRWAIVAYIRALQVSQNPSGLKPLPTASPNTKMNSNTNTSASNVTPITANTNANAIANTNTNTKGGTR